MLEGAGFTVVDLGTNVPAEKMLAAVREHRPPIVGFSAFLTTTMPMLKANLDALAREGLRERVKVMVGGAPVTQEYAEKIGADVRRTQTQRCSWPGGGWRSVATRQARRAGRRRRRRREELRRWRSRSWSPTTPGRRSRPRRASSRRSARG
jgi:hypothetical protein